jgi:hypothetical protein
MKDKENITLENKKILVVGVSISSKGIASYLWEKLPKNLNFADFNVVILDMTRFTDSKFIDSLPCDDLITFSYFENFLYCKTNELIVIGKPFSYQKPSDPGIRVFKFTDYFPHYPEFIDASGDGIKEINQEYEFYFINVKNWNMHLKSNLFYYEFKLDVEPDFIHDNFIKFSKPTYFTTINPIALTLTKHPIAFSFQNSIDFHRQITSGTTQMKTYYTANVINLPSPTKVSTEEAIKSILINRYKMTLELSIPDWVKEYKNIIQSKIESNLKNLNAEKIKIESNIQEQILLLKEEENFQKLLYEQGAVLQSIVHDTLQLFDAEVDRIDEKKDDGKIVDPNGRKGILEIKGKSKSLARKDIRQLDDWKDIAEKNEGYEMKGIIIANCFIGEPLSKRENYFPDDCIKKAKANEFCLLKTSQLFKAICLLKENRLNKNDFWDEIFKTNGVCKLEDFKG